MQSTSSTYWMAKMVYAGEGPFSPATRIGKALDGSETAFREQPIGAGPSNFHDLFDGIREPDPFLVVVTENEVHVGKMYPADPGILADVNQLMSKIEAARQTIVP